MEISRITFTKDFKEKTMGRKLSNSRKGELRIERLKEAERNGTLAKAKTRFEIAQIGGFTKDNYSAGISWVTRMLKKKVITEVLVGHDKHNRAEYEYHLASKAICPPTETVTVVDTAPQIEPVILSRVKENGTVKITITNTKGYVLCVENPSIEITQEIIKTFLMGE